MAIQTYSDLQAAVSTWMARGNVAGQAADFITLAEAGLNRELPVVELDTTLTGTSGSRVIDISALAMERPVALWLAEAATTEERLLPMADGTFAYSETSGKPSIWAIDGTNINFDRPLDQAYPFRLRYRERFALSDTAQTNWLLTNHPDVYLSAVLLWGGVFTRNSDFSGTHAMILERGIPAVRNSIAQSKRGTLTIDPALQMISRGRRFGAWG